MPPSLVGAVQLTVTVVSPPATEVIFGAVGGPVGVMAFDCADCPPTPIAFLADTVYVMSRSPGRMLVRREIDLPRPRPLELTYGKEFTDIVLELREHIGAIRKPPAPAAVAEVVAPRPKPAAAALKPEVQKAYALLSDGQIAGIKERLKLSSSQAAPSSARTFGASSTARLRASSLASGLTAPTARTDWVTSQARSRWTAFFSLS